MQIEQAESEYGLVKFWTRSKFHLNIYSTCADVNRQIRANKSQYINNNVAATKMYCHL